MLFNLYAVVLSTAANDKLNVNMFNQNVSKICCHNHNNVELLKMRGFERNCDNINTYK